MKYDRTLGNVGDALTHSIVRAAVLAAALLAIGCAHQINISVPLDTLEASDGNRIAKTVGYYISATDRTRMVIKPAGRDEVKYLPYQESEPALRQVLSNVFTKVVAVSSLEDRQFITTNEVVLIFVPAIGTDSSSEWPFWPPESFTVTLDCRALDRSGATVWQMQVKGEGRARPGEFKHDFSLAARRASTEAFLKLQQEIIKAAPQFR